ncbi:MAG TPA: hypothetical protein VEK35_00040 [Roseiarcus sp.]|nr:hypothetical protein [Roseiarcus sp.]
MSNFDTKILISLSFILASAVSSTAVAAGGGCDAGRWPLSPIQAKFNAAGLPAVASGDFLPALGAAVAVNLSPQGEVTFPHAPARQGKADPAYGAVVKVGSPPAGTYQVSASNGTWVDLVENSDLVKPAAYQRNRDCPGVDKSIRFKTSGGPLTVQLSGAYGKTVKIEVARAE